MQSSGIRRAVAVLGRGVVPADAAVVAADDLGLTRGDGCFDATRLVVDAAGARVDHLDAHLDRLARSASRLALDCPDADAWRALVDAAVGAWSAGGHGTAAVKLMLTRGSEFAPDGVTALVTVTAFPAQPAALAVVTLSRGHAVDAFADAPWLLGGVKTLSYAVNAAALRHARARGAHDALFVSTDGYALEGTTSALIVDAGDHLASPPAGSTGILDSVTVGLVADAAAAAGVRLERRQVSVAEVRDAPAAWQASSIRGVKPIATLDGVALGRDERLDARLAEWAGF